MKYSFQTPPDLSSEEKRALLAELLREKIKMKNFPLSYEQEQLWLLTQLAKDIGTAYHISQAYRLRGKLDVTALEKSVNEIVKRHESLRTCFVTINGQPHQQIQSPAFFKLNIVNLSASSPADHEKDLHSLLSQNIHIPFCLTEGSLMRNTLFRLDETEHILLIVVHHLVFDGWSMKVFWDELVTLYKTFCSNVALVPLPPVPIQYVDYTQWQRKQLQGETWLADMAYWKKHLAGVIQTLALPTDKPRRKVQTFRGANYIFKLPKELTQKFKELSHQEGTTLFMTLLAAFKVLLYRYTNQTDILVGTPTTNRNHVELEKLIGFFVNPLVLRTSLSGNPTFRQLLGQVREITVAAYTHQNIPFAHLVQELKPERNLSYNPLFQVIFMLQNEAPMIPELPELEVTPIVIDRGAAQFDLSLLLTETEQGLEGCLEYNTALFEVTTITRMVSHLEQLFTGTADNPDQFIAALPLLTDTERYQLLVEWNDTQKEYPSTKCIHDLFEAQVKHTPGTTAVVFGDEELTYWELNRCANQVAHYLREIGVGPETLVGICMKRSIEMVVGILGILKAGGAYIPLDPAYPQKRLAFMLEDTNTSVIVSQTPMAAILPVQHQARIVYLDKERENLKSKNDVNPLNKTIAQNLAYVIYTSGSTGRPKGVAITHQNAVALFAWANNVFTQEELKGVLAATSTCFDLSVYEILLTLSRGGTIILAQDASHLPTLPAREKVTLVNTVPSVMSELIRMNGIPNSVRTINMAGEPLKRTLVQQMYQQTQVRHVYNLYGPSEDTTYSTFTLVTASDPNEPTIGKPIENTQGYIFDSYLQPVPVGITGELYLGGEGLSRGYLNRPGLTAERYIPHPFSNKTGDRLYKTGDLVRFLPDGAIQFLGRIDHQVKIRGYRIELQEIEAVLSRHPNVYENIVIPHEDIPDNKRLIAYLTVKQQPAPTPGELRVFLKQNLPDYMVPSAFVVLEVFPLLPNGKINRQSLPLVNLSRPLLETPFVPPSTPSEEAIAKIWLEVLHLTQVGIYDNFFDVGGHSLLVTQVKSRIDEMFQVDIPLPAFFELPTIVDLNLEIVQQIAQQQDEGMLNEILTELEQLSNDEAQKIIHENIEP